MFGDDQSSRKSPSPGEEEALVPFSCRELSKAIQEYARTHLNETEETRRKGLAEMREFVKDEVKDTLEIPDIFFLCFLRSMKFDIKRACNLLQKGAEFVENHRQIFDRVNSDAVRQTIQSKVVGFLPYRDPKGRAIIYIRSEGWNPNQLKADDVIFGSIVSLHVAAGNPLNQVTGFVVIVDFKNLSVHQVIGMSNWVLFGLQALQRCCPCQVKELHIVHTPSIFRAMWRIVKPLLSEKIRKRITIYRSSHWNNLHRRISPRLLPAELGGELGPYSYEHWASDIADIKKRYNRKVAMFLDRKKRD